MRPFALIVLSLTLLAGCQVGTHARNYPPATGPAGAIVNIELSDRSKLTGELLAVEPTSLLLRIPELVRVPLAQVRSGRAPKVGFDGKLKGNSRERLRLISRYPQGVNPELEAQLLQAYGQDEVKTRP